MSNSSSPAPGTTSSVQEQLPLVIGCAVGYSLAVLSTLFRLLYQFRRRQLWWDDFWAGCAFLCTLVSVTISLKSVLPPPGDYPDSVLSFFAWGTFMMQAAVIWFSRMSILATIIRILPNPSRGRFITKASFAVFFVFWIATTVSKVFYNGTAVKLIPDRPWSLVPTIVVLILNTVATVWLVTWPAYLILRMTSLARPLRRLLTICFGTAIILLAVDIWQAANLFIEAFGLALISAHLELILSLLLANVIILATYIYRIFHNGDGSSGGSDSDTTTKQPRRGSQDPEDSNQMPPMSTMMSSSIGPLTTVYTNTREFTSTLSAPESSAYHLDSRRSTLGLSSTYDSHVISSSTGGQDVSISHLSSSGSRIAWTSSSGGYSSSEGRPDSNLQSHPASSAS